MTAANSLRANDPVLGEIPTSKPLLWYPKLALTEVVVERRQG